MDFTARAIRASVALLLLPLSACMYTLPMSGDQSADYLVVGIARVRLTNHEAGNASRITTLGAVAKTGNGAMVAVGFATETVVSLQNGMAGEIALSGRAGKTQIRLSTVDDNLCRLPATILGI
jgi:hypothetical protein